MKHRRIRILRLISASLVAFVLLGASSQCSAAIKNALNAVSQTKEEARQVIVHQETASSLRLQAQKLESAASQVPKDAELTTSEKANLDQAVQLAAHLKDMAEMVGVSEKIAALISDDAAELVAASILQRRQPSAALNAHLQKTAESLLRDTMCSQFSSFMSAEKESEAQLQRKGYSQVSASEKGVFEALRTYFAQVQTLAQEADQVLDAFRLSKAILTTANTYIKRLEQTVSAASWQNEGAFQAYMRHCVVK